MGIRANSGFVPYSDMTLDQLEEVIRFNEKFIQYPDDRQATKEELRELRVKACRLWGMMGNHRVLEEREKLPEVAEVKMIDYIPSNMDEEVPF